MTTKRFADGIESEQFVRLELESRGWEVMPWGRNAFPDGFNKAIADYTDSYGHPCRLRWLPDLLVMRPGDPQSLRGVEVKRHNGTYGIERAALNVYSVLETEMWLPVIIVFHCPQMSPDELQPIRAGQCYISTQPKFGNPEFGSGSPLFHVDQNMMSTMDAIFGAKL